MPCEILFVNDRKEYSMVSPLRQQKGFTFIELISVLLLLGIVSAVLVSRAVDFDAEEIGGREQIKNYIRFTQLMAMKSDTVCGIVFSGSAYWLFKNGSTADKITLPQNSGENITIHSSLGSVTETIYFDFLGRPYSNASLTTPRPTGSIGGLGIMMYTDTGYVQ